jgi:hypothetical protein
LFVGWGLGVIKYSAPLDIVLCVYAAVPVPLDGPDKFRETASRYSGYCASEPQNNVVARSEIGERRLPRMTLCAKNMHHGFSPSDRIFMNREKYAQS